MPGNFFSYNGRLVAPDATVISPSNRSLRYGDGIFETMQVSDGRIVLEKLHMDRLFKGMSLMQFNIAAFPSPRKLSTIILRLCKANQLLEKSVVRMNVFRGNGGMHPLAHQAPEYIVEVYPPPPHSGERLRIGICYDAVKAAGTYSCIKSNNFLPCTIAALHAAKNNLHDAVVMNQFCRVAETSIANLFCIKEGKIYTPSVGEGCVEGVARRYLLQQAGAAGYPIREISMEVPFLREADEIFVTNVIRGIRSVEVFEERRYDDRITGEISRWWQNNVPGFK